MKRSGDELGYGVPEPKRRKMNLNDFAVTQAVDDDLDGLDELGGFDEDLPNEYEADGLIADAEIHNETGISEYQRMMNSNANAAMDALTEKYAKFTEMENVANEEGIDLSMAVDEMGMGQSHHGQQFEYDDIDDSSRVMPQLSDPKLWMVRCTNTGYERKCVWQLMKKYLELKSKRDKQLHIISAFTADQSTGYIYVEAFKEKYVELAIDGIEYLSKYDIRIAPSLRGRRGQATGIRMVPMDSMTDALIVKMQTPTVKRGQWVRMKKGGYKNDLAQIWNVRDQGSKLIVKLVPRIDLSNISNQGPRRIGRSRNVAPQKAFNPQEIQALGGDVDTTFDHVLQKTVHIWKQKKYYKGFLLLAVDVDKVQFNVTAQRNEVAPFRRHLSQTVDDDEDPEEEELWRVPLPLIKRNVEFKREDTVKVIHGPLQNLTGKVITTTKDAEGKVTVAMLPDHPELNEPLDFSAELLKKFFELGAQVKVLYGNHKDETGLIVKVDEESDKLTIYSDLTSQEITVLADDVVETTEVSTGRDTFQNFTLHDMVELNNGVVGVITQIQTGQFTVLDKKGDLETCRMHEIIRVVNDRHSVTLDRNSDHIRVGDVVIPVTGQMRGERCTVKHIYRITLFLHNRLCSDNGGIFSIHCRQVVLSGDQNKRAEQRRARSIRINGSGPLFNHNKKKGKDLWINATVRITKGNEKGYLGIVKSTTDKGLRVELHAKSKIVFVKRQNVMKCDKHGKSVSSEGSSSTPGSARTPRSMQTPNYVGGQTPHHSSGSHTPYLGASTPMHGSSTPHYGGMTPRSGGMTPRFGDETPHYGGVTPNYGGATPAYGNQTPAYGGQTPAYGGQTPAYGNATPRNDGAYTPNTPGSIYGEINTNANSTTSSTNQTPSWGTNNASLSNSTYSPTSPPEQNSPETPNPLSSTNTSPSETYNQSNDYQVQSMFTPTVPPTPNATHLQNNTYDVSDMSENEPKASYDSLNTFGDDYNSFSETGDGELSTSDVGVSDPRNSDSMTHTDSGNETTTPRNQQKDPFYFVEPGAELKHQGNPVVVSSVEKNQVTIITLDENGNPGQELTVPKDALTYSLPKEGDEVKVVVGDWMNGDEGELIGIDGQDAILKIAGTFEIQILPRDTLVKYRQEYARS